MHTRFINISNCSKATHPVWRSFDPAQLSGGGKESSVDSDAENEEWTEQTEQEKRKVNNASTSKEFCCDASPR